jgi:hypothetical protein
MTSFSIEETDTYLTLKGGLSAEIAFAKYIAHCKKKVFGFHELQSIVDVSTSKSVIYDTLHMICDLVIQNYTNPKNFALISPGFCSVPYIVELMNAVYLPSHLLISFKKISELKEALYFLKEKGIDAYAIAGHDSSFGEKMVAWIRFYNLPFLYQNLLQKLSISKVIISGIWNSKKNINSPKKFYFYENDNDSEIEPLRIYFYDATLRYEKKQEKDPFVPDYLQPEPKSDVKKFSQFILDFSPEKLSEKSSTRIHSWESGFERPNEFLFNFSGEKCHILRSGSKALYELSALISLNYMKINNIEVKGMVLNGYFANNPTFETSRGYIGYCGYYNNRNLIHEILDFLKKHAINYQSNYFLFWINDLNQTFYQIYKFIPQNKILYINDKNQKRELLFQWILQKSKKADWENKKYISYIDEASSPK